MNIFYVNSDPVIAAQSLCNKHVVKMILESCQLMSTAHHVWAEQNGHYIPGVQDKIYKKTHVNHPSAIWTRACHYNYHWLANHTLALCNEYTLRYGKIHKCHELAKLLKLQHPLYKFGGPTEIPQCMPDGFKVEGYPVAGYRRYYNECKSKTIKMEWTKRNPPEWYKNGNTHK